MVGDINNAPLENGITRCRKNMNPIVNTMIIQSGLIAFHIRRSGKRDNSMAKIVKPPTMPYANGESAKKMATTKIVVAKSLRVDPCDARKNFQGSIDQ